MARTFFTKNNGLEHLSDKDNCAVRSQALRLRRTLLDKKFKLDFLTNREARRFILYFRSIALCAESKKCWAECYNKVLSELRGKDIKGDSKLLDEAKRNAKKVIKDIKEGKGLSATKFI